MKRLAIVALVALMATPVSAESMLYYHEPSQYTVLIPETIVTDGTQYTFTAPVMDLCDGEHVEVSILGLESSGIKRLYTSGGKEVMAEFYGVDGKLMPGQTVASFYHGQHEAGLVYALPFSTEGAGDYYGTVEFSINLLQN